MAADRERSVKGPFFKAAKLVLHPFYRMVRGLTIGTRTMVLKEDNQVLLVRHTYAPGWLLPGGGVDRGETVFQAAMREVREEAGIIAEEAPRLHGIYLNDRQFKGDHVVCFVLRNFREEGFKPGLEIAEARFFPAADLPSDTTGGTRRRILEVLEGLPPSREW